MYDQGHGPQLDNKERTSKHKPKNLFRRQDPVAILHSLGKVPSDQKNMAKEIKQEYEEQESNQTKPYMLRGSCQIAADKKKKITPNPCATSMMPFP